jgi:chromosome segregation ATPase
MADVRRVTPQLLAAAKPAVKPAISQQKAIASSTARPATSSAKVAQVRQEIAASQQRSSQLAKRLEQLRARNQQLARKEAGTRRIAVSNQRKLNELLAQKRKADMQQQGLITEVKTFAPKQARVVPLSSHPNQIKVNAAN